MTEFSRNAVFLVSDTRYFDISKAVALAVQRIWACDVHLFVENGGEQEVCDQTGEDGFFVHENRLTKYIPKSAPVSDRWPLVIYGRIFAPTLMTRYHRVIYIDSDIYPVRAAPNVFDIELPSGLAAVQDAAFVGLLSDPVTRNAEQWPASVGLTARAYFNSGVLVIDPKIWSTLDLSAKLDQFLVAYATKTVMPDQDFLNWLCEGKWVELSPAFNFQRDLLDFGYESAFNPVFIHFSGPDKPWHDAYSGLSVHGQFAELYRKLFAAANLDMGEYKRKRPLSLARLKTACRLAISALGYRTQKEKRARQLWQARAKRWDVYFANATGSNRFADMAVWAEHKPPTDLRFDGDMIVRRMALPNHEA